MKKIFLILLTFISLNVVAQNDYFKIKEGSFTHIEGAVMIDAKEHTDVDDKPMALFKISTENINDEQRHKLYFTGNRVTEISDKVYKTGSVWIYITAEHSDFLEIRHPDYGVTRFYFPESLCDFCTYEMVLQYIPFVSAPEPLQQKKYHLIVRADQPDATIYIDDEALSVGEASKLVTEGTTHTYKIECNLYHEESGSVTVNDRTVIEKQLRPKFGYINVTTSPEQGAKVFVDGDYIGDSPIKSDKLASGTHTVRVMKDMFKMKEQSFTVTDGQTTNANITMSANFVTLTVDTDADSDIYIDEEYKGRGRWTGRVSEGSHILEARKQNHRASNKTVDLVLGEDKTITLETPKPIYGSCEITTSPSDANIYIDGKLYGQTPNYVNEILIGTHELKLEKQGCTTITKTITIKENETLTVNEKLQTGKEIVIKTDKSGDKIYVDGNYVGLSPVTTTVAFGSHNIKAERNGKYVSKTITVETQNFASPSPHNGNASQNNEYMLAFVQEINGHEYVDLGLSVKWATCNVGADKPEDYGNYYAWGETSTKSSYTESNSKTYGKNYSDIKGDSRYDAARANWGSTWKMPTKSELEELKNRCTWKWTTQNGVKGYKVTGPNGNSIFLPAAGCRDGSSLYYAGEDGLYWGSTPLESSSDGAYYLFFDSSSQGVDWFDRRYGRSVRPVSE